MEADRSIALHGSWIELSESALSSNLRFLRRLLGRGTRIASVVKGNAYGHGIETFVPMAERCGVRRFAAFGAAEGERVLSCCRRDSQVMIMGDLADDVVPWAVERGVSFWIFDLHRLDVAIRAARRFGRPARVHLELETGLNRTGLDGRALTGAVRRVLGAPEWLRVEGVCSHYAGAESIGNHVRIEQQIAEFDRKVRQIEASGVPTGLKHTACSAAAINYPETRMDLVRIGIAQYGFWPTAETRMRFLTSRTSHGRQDPLRRVMSWKSRVMSLKTVRAGEFVGYGMSHQSARRERLAAVPVGYYHGFSRSLSNLGYVLVNGGRAPVRGLVNMNMILVDVTDLDGVRRGDEVVIIGRQGDAEISVASFADMMNHLNYEVLVRIPSELPRVVVA
jgi:alanine racemase